VSQVDVTEFVREEVEALVEMVYREQEIVTEAFLDQPVCQFAVWVVGQAGNLTDGELPLHDNFCALGDTLAERGWSTRQVSAFLDSVRRLIFKTILELLGQDGQLAQEQLGCFQKAINLQAASGAELLERYVVFRERRMEETHLQNLEFVLDSIPNAILTYDADGCLTYANKKATELMEVNKDEIVGDHYDHLLPLPGYSRNGKKLWTTQQLLPIDGGRGKILIGYPVVRELEYYRILQAQTEFIFNAMTEGLVILDKDNVITTFNSRAEKLFGIPRAEVINRNGSLFLEKLQMDDHLSLLHETLRTGSHYTDIQQTIRSCDGVERILKTSTRTITGDHGEILGAIGIFEDLTDRLFLEEQVRRAEKFSVLGKFAAGIAHEIRNPLTTAKGFLQLLPWDSPDPKIRQLKEVVIPEIDRANEIITDFLMIAKPSAPKLKVDSLPALIEDLVALIQPQAIMQNVELSSRTPERLKAVAMDRDQMLQVFLNLTNNAFDAMNEGGRLSVQVQDCVSHVAVHFRDTGIGMDKETIERVFEPFYTRKQNGTGLGLAVSHRIIEGHNGTIHVTSTIGEGSTFTIQLPFA